jgi:hypothetical protein
MTGRTLDCPHCGQVVPTRGTVPRVCPGCGADIQSEVVEAYIKSADHTIVTALASLGVGLLIAVLGYLAWGLNGAAYGFFVGGVLGFVAGDFCFRPPAQV